MAEHDRKIKWLGMPSEKIYCLVKWKARPYSDLPDSDSICMNERRPLTSRKIADSLTWRKALSSESKEVHVFLILLAKNMKEFYREYLKLTNKKE